MRQDAVKANHIERLQLQNTRSTSLQFWLEPWGEEFSIPAGATYEVEFCGPDDDCAMIRIGNDNIIVYGWSGSTVSVFYEGNRVGGSTCSTP